MVVGLLVAREESEIQNLHGWRVRWLDMSADVVELLGTLLIFQALWDSCSPPKLVYHLL